MEPPYWLKTYLPQNKNDLRQSSLQWFSDARLGMFIHWGVWGPKSAEWAMFNEKIPFTEYKKIADQFDGKDFRAEAIVSLAKKSGMRYITFVAKHHDGFALWNSRATRFDSVDFPAHRDFVGELAAECRRQKIPLFIYYSLGIDWIHPDTLPRSLYLYSRPETPVAIESEKGWTPMRFQRFRQYCLAQLRELCTQYGDLAGFWFDPLGGMLANSELYRTEEFYSLIRKLQPHALILNKTGVTGSEDIVVGERSLSSIARHYPGTDPQSMRIKSLAEKAWNTNKFKKAEIAVTSQGSWCWRPDSKCLPADRMYNMLVQASTQNANLLLNFGPMPSGKISEDVRQEFEGLGALIRAKGYPKLNTSGWRALRGKEIPVDGAPSKTAG